VIQTEQTVLVDCDIDDTWNYARDFERWASIMPGYQSSEIVDADTSRWFLKIGVGAMVRAVQVRVKVENWAGPERVDFSFALEQDPVTGTGSYLARRASDRAGTEMSLKVQVAGTGPMAPMWEAMGGPVLPKFAKAFAEELKSRIEAEYGRSSGAEVNRNASTGAPSRAPASFMSRIVGWLLGLIGKIKSRSSA